MSVYLKLCGIRRQEDVAVIGEFPPDYAGFICSQPFWRYVSPETVRELTSAMRGEIARVGVFVDPTVEQIAPYAPYLDVIQLHGAETAALIGEIRETFPGLEIWKAVRVQRVQDIAEADALAVDKLVLDSFSAQSHGGTGTLAPWDIIVKNRPSKPFLLAGGISADNVQQAIAEVQPWGVDASSSVETDRCKDPAKIAQLVRLVNSPLYQNVKKEG